MSAHRKDPAAGMVRMRVDGNGIDWLEVLVAPRTWRAVNTADDPGNMEAIKTAIRFAVARAKKAPR